MTTFLIVLHIMACFVLIVVVLLQRGKGADMGAALGGGSSQTVFGSRGAGNFLTRLTTASAVIFMMTSLTLSFLSTQDAKLDIMDEEATAPATEAPPSPGPAETESKAETPSPSSDVEKPATAPVEGQPAT